MLIPDERARTVALWLAGLAGGVLGFFVGRGTVNNSEALIALSQALATQHRISAAAPILTTGLTALAAVFGSTLSVGIVWWVIWRSEKGP